MIYINCIVCKKEIEVGEVKVGKIVECKCGCNQICTIIYNDETSGWRVMNPLEIKR